MTELPPDGFEEGHAGNELPPDGFEEANHPGNVFLQTIGQAANQAVAPVNPIQNNQPIQITHPNPARSAFDAAMQTFSTPGRLEHTMSQGANQLGGNAAEGLGQAFPKMPSFIPALAGMATQIGLDPATYVGGSPEAGTAAVGAVDATAKAGLNKLLAPLGQILSGTKQGAIKALFNDPIGTLTSMSSKDAGNALGEIYKGLGLTEDELRLIAKAADRGTGGSQTVYDKVLEKLKAYAANPSEEAAPTMGELIAGRRAASKLSTVRKGMEGSQTVKDLNTFQDAMKQLDPIGATNVLAALQDVAKAKTKEAFLNLLPLNQNMSANALRGMIGLGGAFTGHPGVMAAQAPVTTGLGTLTASAAYNATRAALQNPLSRAAITSQALQNANQNLPQ